MSKTSENNLAIWSQAFPKEAVYLSYLDMRGLQKEQCSPVFSSPPPAFSKKVYLLFGLGLGQDFFHLENWLHEDKDRKIFFFEPDLRVIKKFLSQKSATNLLLSEQASINPVTLEAIDFAAWACYKAPFEIYCHPYYDKRRKKEFLRFSSEMRFRLMQKEALIEEFIDGGLAFFRNFYKNLDHLPNAHVATSFFSQFNGVPAILCGAGPTLQEAIPFLQKIGEKGLLLSGGSATSLLIFEKIRPHLAAVIDPNKTQLSRIDAHGREKIPHFFRLRLFWEALSHLEGEKIYVPGTGGYEVARFFDEALGLAEVDLDEGYNVINFLLSLLVKLGANPIILAGVDLSFQEGALYGKTLHDKGILLDSEKQKEADFGDEVITKKDVHGKSVATLYKWLYEADWISRFAKENPNIGLLRVGGGLSIPGVKQTSWKSLLDTKLTKSYPITSTIEAVLHNNAFRPSKEVIDSAKAKLRESLLKSANLMEELLLMGDAALHSKEKIDQKSVLLEEALISEVAFSAIIDLFNQLVLAMQGPRLRILKMRKELMRDTEMVYEKQRLQNERLAYLLSVVRHNLMLLEWSQETRST